METSKKRLLYVDQLKGIAIFLVVMGHFIQFNSINYKNNILFNVIYSFHMPLFMFLSGYIAFKTINTEILKNYFSFLKGKFIILLIPFFSWPLIVQPLFFSTGYNIDPIKTALILVNNPGGGLWFLWFLFFLYIIYSLFLAITTKLNKKAVMVIDLIVFVIIGAVLAGIKKLGLFSYTDSFILYFIFFFIGIFFSKYKQIQSIVFSEITFSFFLICFLSLCRKYDFNDHSTRNLIIKLVLSISAITCLYYIVNKIKWHRYIDSFTRLLGRYSLVIYVTQFSLIEILPVNYFLPSLNMPLLLLITVFFSLVTVLISLLLYQVLKLSNVLNFLLFGKKFEVSFRKSPVLPKEYHSRTDL